MKNDSENFITNNEKSADAIGERKTNNGFLLAGDSAGCYGGHRNRMPRNQSFISIDDSEVCFIESVYGHYSRRRKLLGIFPAQRIALCLTIYDVYAIIKS